MSARTKLPQEIGSLFGHSDREGLLEREDLEEAGFEYREELGDTEVWEKNTVSIRYDPDRKEILNYTDLGT